MNKQNKPPNYSLDFITNCWFHTGPLKKNEPNRTKTQPKTIFHPNAPLTLAAWYCDHYPDLPVPCPLPFGAKPFPDLHLTQLHAIPWALSLSQKAELSGALRSLCGAVGCHEASTQPALRWTHPGTSAAPHTSCPLDPLPICSPLLDAF